MLASMLAKQQPAVSKEKNNHLSVNLDIDLEALCSVGTNSP